MFSQLDSIQQLQEVYITDSKLKKFSDGYALKKINDSTLQRNIYSLTDVLRQNSTIYFRENGYGMVSSPSFRGTNAAQTAVIWNGIPINSQLTGQTDFNTVISNSFDDIVVRPGGGSVPFGSGAVGGSIHLNNNLVFRERQKNNLKFGYGSFNTFFGNFKTSKSSKHWYGDMAADFISSENDYQFIGKNRTNENGEFNHLNASLNTGWKFGKNTISVHSNYFSGDRNFSGTLTAPSDDNYRDITTRNLVTWQFASGKLVSRTKGAHLYERYRYFPDNDNVLFFEGKSNTLIGGYEVDYHISEKIKLGGVANYTTIDSEGSNIGGNTRNTAATVLSLRHELTSKLSYGLNFRQEFLNDFKNPLLAAADITYRFSKAYQLKVNGSKNFRVPTFNDLFWDAGGNSQLEPETSYQGEIGNVFSLGNFDAEANVYYISSRDLIKWQPNAQGIWQPLNISETENYGAEMSIKFQKKIREHFFNLQGNYAYTRATDKAKEKQLIYVPFHKATGMLGYQFKRISASWQTLYNGEVFNTTDNKGTVSSYIVSNFGVEYQFRSSAPITVGVKINNIFDRYYENVAYRPMPNRNYQLFLNFKF